MKNNDTPDIIENMVRMADFYKEQSHYYMDQAEKSKRERDEARKQNAKLRNIAKRAIEAIPHTEGYGEFSYAQGILRAELDQLKEGGK
jgi:hypothetical protein